MSPCFLLTSLLILGKKPLHVGSCNYSNFTLNCLLLFSLNSTNHRRLFYFLSNPFVQREFRPPFFYVLCKSTWTTQFLNIYFKRTGSRVPRINYSNSNWILIHSGGGMPFHVNCCLFRTNSGSAFSWSSMKSVLERTCKSY